MYKVTFTLHRRILLFTELHVPFFMGFDVLLVLRVTVIVLFKPDTYLWQAEGQLWVCISVETRSLLLTLMSIQVSQIK